MVQKSILRSLSTGFGFAFAIGIVFASASMPATIQQQPYPFEIHVAPGDDRTLQFVLANNGPEDVSIGALDLPWAGAWPFAAKTTVYGRASNNRLDELQEFTDTPTSRNPEVVVSSGQELSEIVSLRSRVVDWHSEDYVGYLVTWIYTLNLCEQELHLISVGIATISGNSMKIIEQDTLQNVLDPACAN